jgi:hypothetical protein
MVIFYSFLHVDQAGYHHFFRPSRLKFPLDWLCAGQLLLMADADGATSIRDLERLERALGPKDGKGRQWA